MPQAKKIQHSNHRGEFTEGNPQLAAREAEWVHCLVTGSFRACLHFESLGADDRELSLVLLSIRVLLETLWDLPRSRKWRSIMEETCPMHQTKWFGHDMSWVEAVRKLAKLPRYDEYAEIDVRSCSMAPIVSQLLARPGWCVHSITAICDTRHYATVIYMGSLRRHLQPWISHASCNDQDRCVAFNVDNNTFECAHVTQSCSCEHVDAPTDSMHDILQSGGIPILRIESSGGILDVLKLSYIRATPGRPYAALSHLWADGLGNVSSNSIPECQVRRLVASITKANNALGSRLNRDGIEIWLDVYCIPSIPKALPNNDTYHLAYRAEMRRLKKLALARMTATYSWAYYVLVIEHELTAINSGHDHQEMWARLAVSGWNRRYWTYQENCLATIVAYECGDGIKIRGRRVYKQPLLPRLDSHLAFRKYVDPYADEHPAFNNVKGILDTDENLIAQPWAFQVWQDLFKLNDRLYATTGRGGDSLNARSGVRKMVGVWNELTKRTTTEWSDSLVIFANLLDLDIAELTRLTTSNESVDPHIEMKAILASQTILPLELLLNEMRRSSCCIATARNAETAWLPLSPQGSKPIELARTAFYMEPNLRRRAVGGWIPTDPQLFGTGSGCGLKVEAGGLLLLTSTLQPSPVSASHLTGEYNARLVRITRYQGRRWILDLASKDFNGEDFDAEYWVAPQNLECTHDPLAGVNEAFIVVNNFPPYQIPARRQGNGACFIPVSDEGRYTIIRFAYPINWGVISTDYLQQSIGGFSRCAASLVGPDHHNLLIQCDIKNWPKLTVRNDDMATKNLMRRFVPASIVALIIMLVTFATVFVTIILLASNSITPGGFWTIRNIWLTDLGITILGLSINYTLAIRHHLDDYLLQYRLLPKENEETWWQELTEALPANAGTEPSFKKRLDISYVQLILRARTMFGSKNLV
ncbi:hypothetical protein K431DRAFT_19066 [Polychaeton citri CBS 116435]|uniref:Heterokaryon incompatibility domain-containing protein n=1 Tax=Polychaeton citri CBS 116435 TaxID=1314669 RepID=A0A9P4PYJ1_9PEZI|nr:hypothetical protein K431DRAFT_19066 [Polychaeton citri CBS 116435]